VCKMAANLSEQTHGPLCGFPTKVGEDRKKELSDSTEVDSDSPWSASLRHLIVLKNSKLV
jgi:hypothetical protein